MMENELQIIYESDNFIIVDKPPDLIINSNDETNKNTLQHLLLAKISNEYLSAVNLKHGFHFIHRLDYATSGVICLGKNKIAASLAGKLFESRQVNKYYIALVRGDVQNELTSINISIGNDKRFLKTNKKMCTIGENCLFPRSALTKILVLEKGYYNNEPATKILLKPLTGRRHQLRLHCEVIGHNIVGDYTYSNRIDVEPPRMFLHSYRLILPVKDEYIDAYTDDPFTHKNEMSKLWCSNCVINQLGDVNQSMNTFEKIDKFEI